MNTPESDPLQKNARLETRITAEALRQLLGLSRRLTWSRLAVVLPVAIVHYNAVPLFWLVLWVTMMLAGILFHEYTGQRFRNEGCDDARLRDWQRILLISRFYLGTVWGVAIYGFYQVDAPALQIFLVTIALVLSIGNIIPAHYSLPLYHVYAGPIFLALTLVFIGQNEPFYWVLALMMVWVFLAGARFARMLNRSFREQIRLRFESDDLSAALARKTEEAEQATQAKSRFLAAASHDLRQPLHALSLFVDVLHEAKSDQERARIFPRVLLSVDALRKLFDALLDVSRLDARVVEPDISHFDIGALLTELAAEFQPAAQEKALKLVVHAQPQTVMTDRVLLARILRNLISNAVRYTQAGGVLLSLRNRSGKLLVQVWDTGGGIDVHDQDMIFQEFHQLDNAGRDRNQGLGLGLALVRRISDLLEHPLTLRSVPGRGSVFSLSIPRGSASLAAQERVGVPLMHSWDLSGRRILVIDDDVEILDAMETLLGKWQCDVRVAADLGEALEALSKDDFKAELVLSDLRLRHGNSGITAINQLREQCGYPLAGVLITGDTDAEVLTMAAASDYEVLQKPLRPAQLRMMIHNALPEKGK